jgi:predicted MFS family arabinose efflux permease
MASTETPAHLPQTRWGLIFLLFGGGVAAAFQIGKVPPALPAVRSELGLSLFAASWLVSIFSILGASSGVFIGALADWIGRRKLILFGMACMTLGNLAGAISYSEALLLVSRFFEGMGYIVTAVATPALIAQVANPADFRMAIAVWGCFMPVGMSMMMLMSPMILDSFGWRGLWFLNAMIVIVIGLLLQKMTTGLTGPGVAVDRPPTEPFRDTVITLNRPGPLLLAAAMMTSSIQFMALVAFLPTFFIEQCHMAQVKASLYTAITVAINLIGTVAGGWLLQKGIHRWRLIASSYIIISLTTLGIYSETAPEGIRLVLCLIFSGIHGVLPMVILAGAPVHAPRHDLMGTTNGLIMQGSNAGHVIGPPILAAVVSATGGWYGIPWLFLFAAGLGVVLSLGIRAVEKAQA